MSERTGAESGVIHDIGFRHYTGQRLGRDNARRTLFVDGLRGAYGLGRTAKSKVMPMLLLAVMTVPALIVAVVTNVLGSSSVPGGYSGYTRSLQVVIAIYVAVQAPASVSRDLRFRVTSLYFVRPLQRIDYVLAKYAALATAVFVLIVIPQTVLLLGALLAKLPVGVQLTEYLAAVAGAVVLALLLAGIGLAICSVTPRRGLGVAAVVTVLLVLSGVQAAASGISDEQGQSGAAAFLNILSPFSLVSAIQQWLLQADLEQAGSDLGAGGGLAFLMVAVAAILGLFSLLMFRYQKVSIS